jgi:hypothetical protein
VIILAATTYHLCKANGTMAALGLQGVNPQLHFGLSYMAVVGHIYSRFLLLQLVVDFSLGKDSDWHIS